MTNLLREYIKLIVEKAVTPAEARKQKLALYIGKSSRGRRPGHDTVYLLYDANMLANILGKGVDTLSKGFHSYKTYAEAVVAMMAVSHPKGSWGAAEVSLAAAQSGYGPLMYDIVMSLEGGLVADRASVSSEAENVWIYYKYKRKDVVAKPLDDEHNPKTKTKKDDAEVYTKSTYDGYVIDEENPLNFAYFMKGSGPAVTTLINNHTAFMKTNPTVRRTCGRIFQVPKDKRWSHCTLAFGHVGNHAIATKPVPEVKFTSKDFDMMSEEFFHVKYG